MDRKEYPLVIKHGVLENGPLIRAFPSRTSMKRSGILKPAMFDDTRGLKLKHVFLQPATCWLHMTTSLGVAEDLDPQQPSHLCWLRSTRLHLQHSPTHIGGSSFCQTTVNYYPLATTDWRLTGDFKGLKPWIFRDQRDFKRCGLPSLGWMTFQIHPQISSQKMCAFPSVPWFQV